MAANHRVAQGDAFEVAVFANDAVGQGRIGHGAAGPDADVGSDRAIYNFCARADEAGRNHRGVHQLCLGRNQLFFVLHKLQNAPVGFDGHVFVAAVHPRIDGSGHKAQAVVFHVLEGVRELVFAAPLDVVVNQVLKLAAQAGSVLKVVDADDGEVADELLGLLDKFNDAAVFAQLNDAKGARILDAVDPNDAVGAGVELEVGPKERVGKGHHNWALEVLGGTQHRVGGAQGLVLVVNASGGALACGYVEQHALDFVAKLTDDVGDLLEVVANDSRNVFDEALHNGLSGHGKQGLGRREGVRTQARSAACHRNNDVHRSGCGMVWFRKNRDLAAPAVAKSALAALGGVQFIHNLPFGAFVARKNELGDALARRDFKRFGTVVYQNHPDRAAVVGVDGSGAVKDGHAVLKRQSGPWTHLGFPAVGQGHAQARGNQASLARLQHYRLIEVRPEVEPCRMRRRVFRQRVRGFVDDADHIRELKMFGASKERVRCGAPPPA